jgi:hypothetical protein
LVSRLDFRISEETFALAKVESLAPLRTLPPDVTASVRPAASPPAQSSPQAAAGGVEVIHGGSGQSKPLIIDVARALAARAASTEPGAQGSP